ncbi:MAG TPA: OmpA family protein [Candidatus Kapabacteria bacterium]|nr:OmpA family protein [Candidatus Kapabacteria bacterium]
MNRLVLVAFLALASAAPLAAQDSTPPPVDSVHVAPPPADTTVQERAIPDSVHLNRDGLLATHFRVGFYAGYARNFHDTHSMIFAGNGDCGTFVNGRGSGPAVGVFGEIPLVDDWLDGVVAVNYLQRGGTFGEVYTGGLPILDPNSNQYVQLQRLHRYTADLGYVFGEIGARITPLPEFPIYLRVGGGIGFTASQPTHHQTEEIISPEGVLYPETNTRIRDVSAGTIPNVGPYMALSGAIGYPLPISRKMTASPEVSYFYPLNDVTPDYRWRISAAQVGVAVRWNFGQQYEFPKPPPPPPPVVVKPAEPRAPQAALASAYPGKIEIVETVVTETFPILPYIFYDSSSTAIPARYKRMTEGETNGFNEKNLPHRSLGAYYDMLNIVGSRMRQAPDLKITLNGTTDGQERPDAADARALARSRADGVKDYLTKTWGIDPKRITVTTSAQPTFPSSMQYAEGAEENRRVEIIASNGDVLHPIVFERFNEHAIEPKVIPFKIASESTAPITSWQLDVYAGDEKVWQRGGTGVPPNDLNWALDQDVAAQLAGRLNGAGSLRCELRVVDANGKSGRSVAEQPANKLLNPFEVSRLSLIVFDFDKSAISESNQQMISAFVSKSMLPSSTASIVGSTDRLGELDHNQELSVSRAQAVRDLVVKEQPKANITNVEGVGPSRLLYDNATPEGRYYCRTVQVEVKTPIAEMN